VLTAWHAPSALPILNKLYDWVPAPTNATGSENISVFASLTQPADLQGAKVIDLFRALFRSSPKQAQDVFFDSQTVPNLSG
jgi:hypothetical protein